METPVLVRCSDGIARSPEDLRSPDRDRIAMVVEQYHGGELANARMLNEWLRMMVAAKDEREEKAMVKHAGAGSV